MPLPFAHETITLYNRKEIKDASGRKVTSWQRTVRTECFWTRRTFRTFINGVVQIGETVKCRIPESPAYVEPWDWETLEDTTDHFTVYAGDIIVHGAVTDEIGAALTETDLRKKYDKQGCIVVTSAKNFCIPGAPLPHYAVEGV